MKGSLVAVAAKVAAVIVAAAVATGVAYKGIQIALDSSGPPVAAKAKRDAPRAGVAGALPPGQRHGGTRPRRHGHDVAGQRGGGRELLGRAGRRTRRSVSGRGRGRHASGGRTLLRRSADGWQKRLARTGARSGRRQQIRPVLGQDRERPRLCSRE